MAPQHQDHTPITGEMPSAVEAAAAIRAGDHTARALLERCIVEIETHNDALNAFVHTDFAAARAEADAVDALVAAGRADELGPLAGVPFAVKDLEDCAGMPTSHGSLLYKDDPPVDEDSIHCARLRAAGAIPIGKTAAPEFGTLHFTRTLAFGTTRNPWNTERTSGGSSGGSAAAVAAGLVPLATASDGGGSTRTPAGFNGLVGMKPSFGRIPSPSADPSQTAVYGVEAVTVRDAARHLDITAGPDDTDRTTLPPAGVCYEDAIESLDVSGLRIGWSLDLGFAVVDPEVAEITRTAAEALAKAAGTELIDYDVQITDPVRTWLSAGALSLWLGIDEKQHLPDRLDDLTPYVKSSIEASFDRPMRTLVPSLRRRLRLEAEIAQIFRDVDVLLTPTAPVVAFAAEGPPPMTIAGRDLVAEFGPAAGAMSTPFTMIANLAWNPACSVPAGLNSEDLPVGLQINGRRHADDVVLRLAHLFEQAQPWPRHAPVATR
jgi:aspartyl-tRNA(Asn)/glutamyl-tRNA(Gln) amidotransferase subunit A